MERRTRHRYLQALGVDVFIRRSRVRADRAIEPAPSAEPAKAAPPRPPAALRSLVAADDTAPTREGGAARAAVPPYEPVESRAQRAPEAAHANTVSAESGAADTDTHVPELHLTVLHAGSSLLVIESTVLGGARERRRRLRLLADVLLAAHMLDEVETTDTSANVVAATASNSSDVTDRPLRPAVIEFWWPQVASSEVDQRVAVAWDALDHFVAARVGARGKLLLIQAAPPLGSVDGEQALQALAWRTAQPITLPTELVTEADASAKRAAWLQLTGGQGQGT